MLLIKEGEYTKESCELLVPADGFASKEKFRAESPKLLPRCSQQILNYNAGQKHQSGSAQ